VKVIVIVTEKKIEIYREDLDGVDGCGCREFAQWMMAWAAGRLADQIASSLEEPHESDAVLCD
jgi:hypothetical protein